MEETVIQATRRQVIGKQVKALRRAGKLPGVLYGRNMEPIPLTMDAREAGHILGHLASSAIVTLELDGKRHLTLIREKQRNFILGNLIHIDFQAVSEKEKLRVEVGIQIVGESPAVKQMDGVMVMGREELEVECFPQDLPEQITVDISGLVNIGDSIRVRDIVLPPNVQVLVDAGEMIVLVTAPAAEEVVVEEEVAEAVPVEPEVIERGKKEEEVVEETE
jgi:large subunit ribosomal protein L25